VQVATAVGQLMAAEVPVPTSPTGPKPVVVPGMVTVKELLAVVGMVIATAVLTAPHRAAEALQFTVPPETVIELHRTHVGTGKQTVVTVQPQTEGG